MSVPRVSLAVPVYNGSNYISAALDSLLGQTFRDFELIVSDNASTDGTWDICCEYSRRDARIRLHRFAKNTGATKNFNHALSLARAPYFKWASHDDLLGPTFLEECVKALDADPSAVIAYPLARIIDEHGGAVDPGDTYDPAATFGSGDRLTRLRELVRCRHRCFPIFGLIRTDVLRGEGGLENYSHADRILLGRLAMAGRFHQVPEPLFVSRVHGAASARLFSDPWKLRAWWDPEHKSGHLLPHWKLFWEYLRLVHRAAPERGQRLRGYVEVFASLRVRWWRRKLASDLGLIARSLVMPHKQARYGT